MLKNIVEFSPKKEIETKSNNNFDDPWGSWKPRWRKNNKQKKKLYDLQEEKEPTIKTIVNINSEKIECNRRIIDSRIWDNMMSEQQDAAVLIEKTFQIISSGSGYSSSDPSAIPDSNFQARGLSQTEYQSELVNIYFEWATNCTKEKISHSLVIDILVFGKSCTLIDSERRIRKGASKINLIDALNIYCDMRGWQ